MLTKSDNIASYLLAGTRIVIKYGTNALTTADSLGRTVIDQEKVEGVASIANTLYAHKKEPIIVSSAAVVVGMGMLGWEFRPSQDEIRKLQLASTVGQARLVEIYNSALAPFKLVASQMLPVHYNFQTLEDRANIKALLNEAFANRAIPLFNTNDGMTNEELVNPDSEYNFTDNDPLAKLIAVHGGAYSLIIVSENGTSGKGGKESKIKAMEEAERNGVHTNLNRVIAHSDLEVMVKEYFSRGV